MKRRDQGVPFFLRPTSIPRRQLPRDAASARVNAQACGCPGHEKTRDDSSSSGAGETTIALDFTLAPAIVPPQSPTPLPHPIDSRGPYDVSSVDIAFTTSGDVSDEDNVYVPSAYSFPASAQDLVDELTTAYQQLLSALPSDPASTSATPPGIFPQCHGSLSLPFPPGSGAPIRRATDDGFSGNDFSPPDINGSGAVAGTLYYPQPTSAPAGEPISGFPQVLFLHGYGGADLSASGYDALSDHIASYGFVVLAIRSRDADNAIQAGLSVPRQNPISHAVQAVVLHEAFRDLVVSGGAFPTPSSGDIFDPSTLDTSAQVGVVGHSMGAMASIYVAELVPDHVRVVVALQPGNGDVCVTDPTLSVVPIPPQAPPFLSPWPLCDLEHLRFVYTLAKAVVEDRRGGFDGARFLVAGGDDELATANQVASWFGIASERLRRNVFLEFAGMGHYAAIPLQLPGGSLFGPLPVAGVADCVSPAHVGAMDSFDQHQLYRRVATVVLRSEIGLRTSPDAIGVSDRDDAIFDYLFGEPMYDSTVFVAPGPGQATVATPALLALKVRANCRDPIAWVAPALTIGQIVYVIGAPGRLVDLTEWQAETDPMPCSIGVPPAGLHLRAVTHAPPLCLRQNYPAGIERADGFFRTLLPSTYSGGPLSARIDVCTGAEFLTGFFDVPAP